MVPVAVLLEVIAASVEDAVAAEAGGAGRLELVTAIDQDGLTPDLRLVERVKRAVRIPVYVMIRMRGGDFVYSPEEVRAMQAQARSAREAGADGIVTGVLRPDRSVDIEATHEIVAAAGLPATFHRAVDASRDIQESVRKLGSIPLVERVLTSGGRKNAYEGIPVIARLCRTSPVEVMPGAGVTLENVGEIIRRTGARSVHVGSAAREPQRSTAPVSVERVVALRRTLDAVAQATQSSPSDWP